MEKRVPAASFVNVLVPFVVVVNGIVILAITAETVIVIHVVEV